MQQQGTLGKQVQNKHLSPHFYSVYARISTTTRIKVFLFLALMFVLPKIPLFVLTAQVKTT